jgi:tetratricopeptide (TPR) repeat protein
MQLDIIKKLKKKNQRIHKPILRKRRGRFREWDAKRPGFFVRTALIGGVLAAFALLIFVLLGERDIYRGIENMTSEGRYEEAGQLAAALHERDPLDIRALILLGRNAFYQAMQFDYEQRGETRSEEGWEMYKNAVEALKKAILLDKEGVLTSFDYFILGFSYMKRGNQYYSEAIQFLRQAESHDTNDLKLTKGKDSIAQRETLQQMLGYLYYQTGNYTNALHYYRSHNARPNILNYVYIGLCEVALGQYTNAMATFALVRSRARQRPIEIFAIKQLARLHFHLGQYDDAERYFKMGVNLDTSYAEGFYWLGKLMELRGDLPAAREYWEQSLAADPHFGPTILKLHFSPQHRTQRR